MFFFYSLLLTLAFIIMSPLFLLRRQKYAAGFRQRLGNYPEFTHDHTPPNAAELFGLMGEIWKKRRA